MVLSEVLSDPRLPPPLDGILIPVLTLEAGFWERAGRLRARIAAAGHKAKLADTRIAQSCLDHDVPLVTRVSDFRHFVATGLTLIPG